jgi:hypothetical protein
MRDGNQPQLLRKTPGRDTASGIRSGHNTEPAFTGQLAAFGACLNY